MQWYLVRFAFLFIPFCGPNILCVANTHIFNKSQLSGLEYCFSVYCVRCCRTRAHWSEVVWDIVQRILDRTWIEIGGTQVSSSVLKAKSSGTTHYYNSIWNTLNDVVPQLVVCMISTGKIPFAAANFLQHCCIPRTKRSLHICGTHLPRFCI